MSSLTSFIDCPAIQDDLERIFPFGSCEPLPIAQFLFSSMNNNLIMERNISPGNGLLRDVQLVYSRRILESEVGSGNFDCNALATRGETSHSYTLDETPNVLVEKKYNILDINRRCKTNADYFNSLVAALINGLDRKIETMLATKLVALVGAYSVKDKNIDATNSAIAANQKVVKTLESSGALSYNAHQSIMQTAQMNAYCGMPVVLGAYTITQYYDALKVGCCTTGGIDFSKVSASEPLIINSYRIADALGSTLKFLTMAPGAALPVWYNRYVGDMNVLNDDSNYAGTVISPMTGIEYDFRLKRNCDDIHVEIGLAWDLFGAPSDMFENSDPLDDITWVNKYLVTNP